MLRKLSVVAILIAATLNIKAVVVDTISIATEFLASPEDILVITPEIAKDKPCPTVYLLNGHSGNHLSWTRTRPDLPQIADRYGMIFVMPDGRDSWYWDSPVDPKMQMESFMTNDLVPYIDSHYNTIKSAGQRAITGLSMGGHGGLWLSMRHPDIWGNGGSTSGGLDIRPFPERWHMKDRLGPEEGNQDIWDSHTVINLVPTLKPGEINIIFDCGSDDFFYEVNNNTHQALLEAGIPHDYISRPGAHNGKYWANSILFQLLYFNEQFNK